MDLIGRTNQSTELVTRVPTLPSVARGHPAFLLSWALRFPPTEPQPLGGVLGNVTARESRNNPGDPPIFPRPEGGGSDPVAALGFSPGLGSYHTTPLSEFYYDSTLRIGQPSRTESV